jgi:hypothetical protein
MAGKQLDTVAASGWKGRVRGRWRSRMREMPKVYRSRWHVESFLSGQKRTTGSQLTAWREKTLNNEAALWVVAYAVRR